MRSNWIGQTAGRLALLSAAALALASLAGCGPPDWNAMNATYDKSVHDACVTTATAKVGAAAAETYCTCVTGQLDSIPIQQRIALTPASNELTTAAAACNQPAGATGAPAGEPTGAPTNSGQ